MKWGAGNTLADQLSPCGSGGGSGGGTWATTTPYASGPLINYSLSSTDIVTIGAAATSSAKFFFDPNTLLGIHRRIPRHRHHLAVHEALRRRRCSRLKICATSSLASIFPYASSTAISATIGYFSTASTTNLNLGFNSTILSTNGAGGVQATSFSGPLSFSGSTFSISQAGGTTDGYLSSTD